MAVMNDAGSHATLGAIQSPQPLALGHITAAARLDSNGVAAAHPTAHRHQRTLTPDRRCVNRAAKAFAQPQLLAGLGIVSSKAIGKVHDQFVMAVHFHDDRSAPRPANRSPETAAPARPAGAASATGTTRPASTARTARATEIRSRKRRIKTLPKFLFIERTAFVAVPVGEPFRKGPL